MEKIKKSFDNFPCMNLITYGSMPIDQKLYLYRIVAKQQKIVISRKEGARELFNPKSLLLCVDLIVKSIKYN